jgi:serine/threonine-protein kinase
VQHLKTEPKRLEVVCPHLPEGLCRIVHKMLAKKPEERYQRAIDLLKDLKSLNVEGLDHDWAAELPGFNSADMALSTAGRLEATQALQKLLASNGSSVPRRWTAGSMVTAALGLALMGLVAGGVVAWLTRPPPLLATPSEGGLKTQRLENVKKQYDFALLKDTEDAWRAVEEYFPPEKSNENLYYTRLARRGRARLYVAEGRLSEALKLYAQLANVPDSEADLQLSGIAGEAVVYHLYMQTEQDPNFLNSLDEQVILRLLRLRDESNLDQRIGSFLAKQVRQIIEEYQQREEN